MLASIFAIIAALLSLEFVAVLVLDTFILTFLVVLGVFPDRYKCELCKVGYHDLGYHINLSRQETRVKQMRVIPFILILPLSISFIMEWSFVMLLYSRNNRKFCFCFIASLVCLA